jgi:hypothetical protein
MMLLVWNLKQTDLVANMVPESCPVCDQPSCMQWQAITILLPAFLLNFLSDLWWQTDLHCPVIECIATTYVLYFNFNHLNFLCTRLYILCECKLSSVEWLLIVIVIVILLHSSGPYIGNILHMWSTLLIHLTKILCASSLLLCSVSDIGSWIREPSKSVDVFPLNDVAAWLLIQNLFHFSCSSEMNAAINRV